MATAKGARTGAVWGAQFLKDAEEQRVMPTLKEGYNTARYDLNKIENIYNPMATRYNAGSAMYSDALGLGGATGTRRAQQAFNAGPGYSFAMDQGMEALNRRRAAGGMLNSGNADADAMTFGQGLANQNYGQWLDRLGGMDQRGLQLGGARAATQGALADLATQYANRQAGVIQDNVNNIVGLNVGALKAGDQARAQNEANTLGMVTTGLNLLGGLSGMGGGGGGLGGLFSKIGGLVGGPSGPMMLPGGGFRSG